MNQNDKSRIQDIMELAAELAEYVNQGREHFDSELPQIPTDSTLINTWSKSRIGNGISST